MNNENNEFLANIKLIFEHGVKCSKNKSKLMRLLAIHELHYVIEQIFRQKSVEHNFSNQTKLVGFKEILSKLDNQMNIPDKQRLLDLNEDRNRAEHQNKIPPSEEIQFYVKVTRDFLKWSYKNYFSSDFDSIRLEDQIIDKPIRRVIKWSRDFIDKGDLKSASTRMYEGLGAFKFMMFKYLSDYKISKQMLEKQGLNVDLADILATFAFKIICADDLNSLKKLTEIKTNYLDTDGIVGVRSDYQVPNFKDKEEAERDYEEILDIIITYQDRIPAESWREVDSYEKEHGLKSTE